MNRHIKDLVEEYVIGFNPAVVNDDRQKSRLSSDTVSDIVGPYPDSLEKLREIVVKRAEENPTKPYLLDIDTS